jgi:hypothetical protein
MFCVGYGCKEEDRLDQMVDNSDPAPLKVTVIENTPRPGGAVLKYTIPNDKNLLGVKAVYVRNGETCETKASLYTDSLTMEGFGDTQTYEVNLYSVGRNGKLSDPEKVSITPLTPPVLSTEISMEPTFGGVKLSLSNNTSKAALAVMLLIDTANTGKWELLHTFYTMADHISFVRRELESKEQTFGVVIRDRWNNKSDTLSGFVITPYEEIKLVKTSWTNAKLPTDYYASYGGSTGYRLENLWEGTETVSGTSVYATPGDAPIPFHFTVSLGYKASISRLQLWARPGEVCYKGNYPREFEVWGSDDPPEDGSWDNWHLLGKFEVFKPSGYGTGIDVGPITAEDIDYFSYHQEYEFSPTDEISDPNRPVRFIRFKIVNLFNTYGLSITSGHMVISEIALWGTLHNN